MPTVDVRDDRLPLLSLLSLSHRFILPRLFSNSLKSRGDSNFRTRRHVCETLDVIIKKNSRIPNLLYFSIDLSISIIFLMQTINDQLKIKKN